MFKTTTSINEANAITHGGEFHSDDVFATVVLEKLLGNVTVFRTSDVPEGISDDVIVYDVGYGKYDHHQSGGNGCRENGVPCSSVGLLWKDFGHQLVKDTPNPNLVWELIDRDLIQGIDANDNGTIPKVNYPTNTMSISGAISGFNPNLDSQENYDDAFVKAVAFAKIVFENTFANTVSKIKVKGTIEKAISESEGHIAILDMSRLPWKEFILTSNNPKAKDLQFVVFPSDRGGYNWQGVPDALGSFEQRKSVPTEWRGLNGAELRKLTGIKTARFCHPKGFIGGAETLEDTIAFIKLAIDD